MINFHTLDNAAYKLYRYDIISAAEGVVSTVYLDTAGIPSNGIGFNLMDDNILKLVLKAFGVIDQASIDDIAAIINNSFDNGTNPQTLLNSKMNLLAGLNPPQANRSSFAFSSGAAGVAEMRAVFDTAVLIYDNPDTSIAPLGRVDKWLADIPPSKERAVLVSLSYNGLINAGTSPSLRDAVLSGDRAEAWYEIRYNSNSDEQHTVRRYDESDKFGLYDPGSTTFDEAYSIYQTYTMHKDAIFAYEDKYGEGDQSLSQELTQAASLFVDKYREYIENPVRGADRNIDPTNIQVTYPDKTTLNGEDTTTRIGSNNDLLVGMENQADTLNGLGGNDVLIGGSGNDTLDGGDGNDVLVGGADNDMLIGGQGDDWLYGGTGDDTLKGGAGNDTYIYKTGDGSDTIDDSDAKGVVKYDDTPLSGGIEEGEGGEIKKATKAGTYKSDDKKYTYVWAGEGNDLVINGNITVKNFHNGDLGITLKEREKKKPNDFDNAQHFIQHFYDPLTLDLNGDGIHTVPLKTPPLLFDLNASGIKVSTGWIAPDDGLLVMDRNGNGTIDSGAELFGDATPAYGTTLTGRTADGFAALAQEDTNGDGVVNNLDANWANLRVWQDLNQDGISQSNELTTLEEQGIASFNVARTVHSQMLPSGNQMSDLGTFTRTDGSSGNTGAPQAMADINLSADTFHRTFTDTIPLTAQAETLPDMQGSGKVRDLQQAASLQTAAGQALSTVLANYSSAGTREEQLARIDGLLAAWADSSGFGTLQSRAAEHGYTVTTNLSSDWQKKLSILETFNGRGFFKMPWDGASVVESGVQGLSIGQSVYDNVTRSYVWDGKKNRDPSLFHYATTVCAEQCRRKRA